MLHAADRLALRTLHNMAGWTVRVDDRLLAAGNAFSRSNMALANC
jgi:hypothetical protein